MQDPRSSSLRGSGGVFHEEFLLFGGSFGEAVYGTGPTIPSKLCPWRKVLGSSGEKLGSRPISIGNVEAIRNCLELWL